MTYASIHTACRCTSFAHCDQPTHPPKRYNWWLLLFVGFRWAFFGLQRSRLLTTGCASECPSSLHRPLSAPRLKGEMLRALGCLCELQRAEWFFLSRSLYRQQTAHRVLRNGFRPLCNVLPTALTVDDRRTLGRKKSRCVSDLN